MISKVECELTLQWLMDTTTIQLKTDIPDQFRFHYRVPSLTTASWEIGLTPAFFTGTRLVLQVLSIC